MEFQIRSILILFLINAFISHSFALRSCVTAREESGECKEIRSCPYMLNILNMTLSHPEYRTYLQKSRCPNFEESQNEVIICCPIKDNIGIPRPKEPVNPELDSFALRSCVTDREEPGECKEIRSCPYMLNILNMTLSHPEYRTYLQKSRCPNFEESQKEVITCCPDNDDIVIVTPELESLAARPCFTAREESGECREIHSCPYMLNIVNMTIAHPEYRNYLQQSQCSNTEESHTGVIICCPTNPLPLSKQTINLTYNSVLPAHCREENFSENAAFVAHGTPAGLDEYPWMVQVYYEGRPQHGCGGSLINERYVLTAAHCFPNNIKAINVRLGEYDISQERDCLSDQGNLNNKDCADPVVTIPIEKIIVHKDYDFKKRTTVNDIALLRLARHVSFTKYTKPICLPQNANIEQWLFTAGWGTMENGYKAEKKMKLKVPLHDFNSCKRKYRPWGKTLQYGQFCAGGEVGGEVRDTCDGDSGGPIMAKMKVGSRKEWTLFGITSFGRIECGVYDFPGVYTKVHYFMPWILENLRA